MSSVDADTLPTGWEVWNEDPGGRLILAFRPDIFDTQAHPAECLPTITVAPGRTPDRPLEERARSKGWHVVVYLEPTVPIRELGGSFDARDDAVVGAIEAAERFSAGSIDLRSAYQVPRDGYLAQLAELTEWSG